MRDMKPVPAPLPDPPAVVVSRKCRNSRSHGLRESSRHFGIDGRDACSTGYFGNTYPYARLRARRPENLLAVFAAW